MNDYYCAACYKTIKNRSKKKHLDSKSNKFLSKHIVFKYQISKPNINRVKDILEKYITEHNKKFIFYVIICKLKTESFEYIAFDIYNRDIIPFNLLKRKNRSYQIGNTRN